jgi:formate hydrogenlyase subunit 3/multisubunit Na+/H+ antiporter MnhD subunit
LNKRKGALEKKIKILGLIAFSLLLLSPSVSAFVKNGLIVSGNNLDGGSIEIEIEAIISFASSILAVFLLVVSFLAYKRDKRRRLLFVLAAFLLFAIKGVLFTLGEVISGLPLNLEPIALFLDFGILMLLFAGIVKE